jgi:hypothetical protein
MPTSFRIMVYNDDEGEDLGQFEADYLPRVGDDFALWHPRVCKDRDVPFLGVVNQVRHEAHVGERAWGNDSYGVGSVSTTVWLVEEFSTPTRYCDCSPAEREKWSTVDGLCESCRGQRVEKRK